MLCKEDNSLEKDLVKVEDEIKAWEKGFEIEFEVRPTSEDISARPKIALKYKLCRSLRQALMLDKDEDARSSSTLRHASIDSCDGDQLSQKRHVENRPNQPSSFHSQSSDFETREEEADVESLFDHNSSFLSYFEDSVSNTKALDGGEFIGEVENGGGLNSALGVESMSALVEDSSYLSTVRKMFNISLESGKAVEAISSPKDEEPMKIQTSGNHDRLEGEETGLDSEVQTTALLPNFFGAGIHTDGGANASSLSDQVRKNIHLDLSSSKEETSLGFDDKVDPGDNDVEVQMPRRKRARSAREEQTQEDDAKGVRKEMSNSRKKAKSSLNQAGVPPVLATKKRENFVRLNLKNEYKKGRTYGRKNAFRKILEERNPDDQEAADGYQYMSVGESTGFLPNDQESISSREKSSKDTKKVEEVVNYCRALKTSVENGVLESEKLVGLLKLVSKFDRFLPGQEQALRQIIQGRSTLLILPTGMGKSLCYQLASCFYLNEGITIVVSPLVSLMIDQLKNLFDVLRGVSLGYHKSQRENESSMDLIKSGNCDVVFMSPERLASGEFEQTCQEMNLKINLCCVDEVHCISTWSHNFRPAYLSIYDRVVRKLGARCVLAMTATATRKTERSICELLRIDRESVIRFSPLREHLQLSVLEVKNDRYSTLESALRRPEIQSAESIIIYVMFQRMADNLSFYLIQRGWEAGSYHAGKSSSEKQKIQSMFCSGKIRILVATIAFGMGLDKSNVRAVIHFSMPKSIENYVQEVGRAGRDGSGAFCYLLFDKSDIPILRSMAHADTQDRATVKHLLLRLWPVCQEESSGGAHKRYVSFGLDECEKTFDMKLPIIQTILTWLENERVIEALPPTLLTCELKFFEQRIEQLKTKSKLLSQAVQIGKKTKGALSVPLDALANLREEDIADTLRAFKQLQTLYQFSLDLKNRSLLVRISEELSGERLDSCIDSITEKIKTVEVNALAKLKAMQDLVESGDCPIHQRIRQYFLEELDCSDCHEEESDLHRQAGILVSDVRVFLSRFADRVRTARQVARIMHGIASPKFSKEEWQHNPFWGKKTEFEFNAVLKIAQEQLIAMIKK